MNTTTTDTTRVAPKDATFTATLKAASLTARKHPDRPGTTLRRVRFALAREFGPGEAEWLGENAVRMRTLLQRRDLRRVEIPIDGYHAKVVLSGISGSAETEVEGVTATACVVGAEDQETEKVTFVFEAFPEAKLLTFLAASLKGAVACEFLVSQLALEVGA